MRRRVLLLVAATTSLVLVAFLVPLALLVRTVAAERAVLAATADAQALTALVAVADPAALAVAVAQVDADVGRPRSACFTADGAVLGAPAPRTPLVELAARGSSASGIVDGGREIVFAVRDPAGRHRRDPHVRHRRRARPRASAGPGCCSPGSGSCSWG